MPPKRRGFSLVGKDKIFRNAIEHVHVGVGYTVLGNFSLNLVAGSAIETAGSSYSAFQLELNELMLSYTSTDFKKFRFEVLPLCESKAMLQHQHKAVAHKLLMCLANKDSNEGFFAFLKLTIAFARDMQAKFLPYFEAFHNIVNNAIYDKSGHLIPDTERLQLIFATQVAWLRELGSNLTLPEYAGIVEKSVIACYIRQMSDSKEYIRRLVGEVLASCCRVQRRLVPLVVELAAIAASAAPAAGDDAHSSDEDDADDDGDALEMDRDDSTKAESSSLDPVLDSLTAFVADMLRGLRGSLHTNFDEMLKLLMVSFQMVDANCLPVGAALLHAESQDAALASHIHSIAGYAVPHAFQQLAKETKKYTAGASGSVDAHPIHRMFSGLCGLYNAPSSTAVSGNERALEELLLKLLVIVLQVVHSLDTADPLEPLAEFIGVLCSRSTNRTPTPADIGQLLQLIAPFLLTTTVESEEVQLWLGQHFVEPLVKLLQHKLQHKICSEDSSSIIDVAAAFLQDLLQKNRAWCMSVVEKAETVARDSDDSADDESAADEPLVECFIDPRVGVPLMAVLLSWMQRHVSSSDTAGDRFLTVLTLACEKTSRAKSSPLELILTCNAKFAAEAHAYMLNALRQCSAAAADTTHRNSLAVHTLLALLPPLLTVLPTSSGIVEIAEALLNSNWDLPVRAHSCDVLVSIVGSQLNSKSVKTSSKTRKGAKEGVSDLLSREDVARVAKQLDGFLQLLGQACLEQSSAQVAADMVLSQAIGYTLQALQSFIGSSKRPGDDDAKASLLLSTRICSLTSAQGQKSLVALCLKALSSPYQHLRLRCLRLLRGLCFEDERIDAAGARVADCQPLPAAFFDALIGAETADPLSGAGNVDAAKMFLTKVAFHAAVGRVQNAFQQMVLLQSSFGLLHVKFADVWPIALKMISDLLRCEAAAAKSGDSRNSAAYSLWAAVEREARDIVFASPLGSINKKGQAHVIADSEATWRQHYELTFSDMQHHVEGSLVSKGFARAKHRDSRISVMESLAEGQLADLTCIGDAMKAAPFSTDAVTVARTFLTGLKEIVSHAAGPTDPKVLLVEALFKELSDIDRGTHETLTTLRSLEDRLLLAFNALAVAPTTAVNAARLQHEHSLQGASASLALRTAVLVEVCNYYLPNSNCKLQRAAAENLRRLKILPFEPHLAKILPFCGSNMKEAFSFASSFHVDSDIPEEHRIEYIASIMVVVLPKLSTRVAKEKLKDQAVLGRRVMSYLQHVSEEGLSTILDRTMSHILSGAQVSPQANSRGGKAVEAHVPEKVWETYDFIRHVCSPDVRHCARRFEQVLRQLSAAAKVLSMFISSVGSRFSKWSFTCFVVCLQAYNFSSRPCLPDNWKNSPGLSSSAISTAATALRKQLGQCLLSLLDQFPDHIMSRIAGAGCAAPPAAFEQCIRQLYANSKTLSSTPSHIAVKHQSSAGTGVSSTFLRLVMVLAKHAALHPLVAMFGDVIAEQLTDALAPSAAGSDSVHRASSDTVFAALSVVSQLLVSADEEYQRIQPGSATGCLGSDFIDQHLEPIFAALHGLVLHGQAVSADQEGHKTDPARRQKRVMGFTIRMWGEVIQTVALLAERINTAPSASRGTGGRKPSTRVSPNVCDKVQLMVGQLLEIALKFVSNPLCCSDTQAVLTASSVVETLIAKVTAIHPAQHYHRLVSLFNKVTNPHARLSLCRSYQIMIQRYSVANGSPALLQQFMAVSRALAGLNSFAPHEENDADERRGATGEDEEEGESTEVVDRYDFERRYHGFHSLMTFFNNNGNYGVLPAGGLTRQSESSSTPAAVDGAAADANDKIKKRRRSDDAPPAPKATAVRTERTYEGDQDVRIPLFKESQPVLANDALMALAENIMFFLRDPERAIRSLAAQTLFAMLKYISHATPSGTQQQHQSPTTAGSEYADQCLASIIRPIVLSSLRQGVVAKDPSIRLAHMESFGGLAKYFGRQFPSFSVLYSPNSERNFFLNVGHAQHKCRLNALALLRKQSANMNVRDLLRVFVPFLLVTVKDFAQGKRESGSSVLTEGRAKGHAESVLMTMATLATHLPWEGYYYVLRLLLTQAKENDSSLQLTMLKGVVHVLQSFHFLDELHSNRPAVDDALASSSSDDDGDEGTALISVKRQRHTAWRHDRIIAALEGDILPQLYSYITTGKKEGGGGKHSETRVSDLTAEKVLGGSSQGGKKDNRAITQLPVAVAIAKIVRLFPEASFEHHIDQVLHEIILRLRTKNDKQRENARKVLCSVMREIGPGKLRMVITKLKDNFVHGYQLHVLGYTVVTLLYSLYAPASPYAMLTRSAAKQVTRSAQAAVAKRGAARELAAVDDSVVDDLDDDLDGGMPGASGCNFNEAAGRAVLEDCMDLLFDIFMDDYLGEIGAQKEQIELMSTLEEVKRSRALQGFVFMATYCDATVAMSKLVQKIAWVLAPPTAVELSKKAGTAGAHVLGTNTKYVSGGEKNAVADIKFVNKVRFMALRVARALMTNKTLDLSKGLESVKEILSRHNAVREEKIREFEAKDGSRRIRGGSWDPTSMNKRRTGKELYEQNFAVAAKPERIDVDFNAPTVLVSSATQQKQKLRAYRGRYAKQLGEASRGFANEDPETAVVLDTLDEFCLKFLLSVLKRVLGIGKEKKLSSIRFKPSKQLDSIGGDAESDTAVDPKDEDEVSSEASEAEQITDEVIEQAIEREEELLEGAGDGEALDELGEFHEQQLQAEEEQQQAGNSSSVQRRRKKPTCVAPSFAIEYKPMLEALVSVVLTSLEGEGSDTVVSHALDVLHALISLRPPLDSVETSGKAMFESLVQFLPRGGVIKQRALRVMAAVVQHKKFTLQNDDASRLVRLVRTELIDGSEYLPNSLLVLQSVLGKHALVEEVYDIIAVVTETMMHWAHAPVVRTRCVSCIAKFLTEYKITREKLKSHIDFYVRNLPIYTTSAGRIALMELLDVLILRFPIAILREEAPVIFVPLCAVLCRSEWRECKEKAAAVLGRLVANAGIVVVQSIMLEWLVSKSVGVRTSALQVLGVLLPYIATSVDNDAEQLLEQIRGFVPHIVSGCMTSEEDVLSRKERERQEASKLESEVAAKRKSTKSKKEKVEQDQRGWQPIFFALRCMESAVDVSPDVFFVEFGEAAIQTVFSSLLEHTHPWVRGAATRVAMKYLYQFVEPRSGYFAASVPAVVAEGVAQSDEVEMPACCCVSQSRDDDSEAPSTTPLASFAVAEAQLAKCSKWLKRVLASVESHDVPNEKYEANRAIADPSRTNTVKVAIYLAKAVTQLCIALLCAKPHATHVLAHYDALWTQMVSLATPALNGASISGYVVRVASLTQMLGGVLASLPRPIDGAEPNYRAACEHLLARLVPSYMYGTLVPVVASAMESSFDTLSAIGSKVYESVRAELQARADFFQPSSATQPLEPKTKKSRAEKPSTVAPHRSNISVEDVMVSLTRIAEEKRSAKRDAETRKQAAKSIKRSRSATS